jgi:hypothetical protein
MDTTELYIERLQQAVRVMEGLSQEDRANFDIQVVAVRTERGIRACVAGHCGLDPWFQAQGLTTFIDDSGGDVSIGFREFFGTMNPFLRSRYPAEITDGNRDVTVDDAIAALNRSIEMFTRLGEAATA